MENRGRRVIGSYGSVAEARKALETLESDGYAREDITLYANERNRGGTDVPKNTDLQNQGDPQEDDSFWEEVKDIFRPNRSDDVDTDNPEFAEDRELLAPYQEDLTNGHIVLALRGDNAGGMQL